MTIINTGSGIMKAGGGIGKSGRSLGYKFGINRTHPLSAAQPAVIATIERISGSADASNNFIRWQDVETARGVYNWTVFDALVADVQSRGADIVYTFVGVPGWANGGSTNDVPPTSFSDFYTFVTAVVQRYAGKIKYYEAWNEPDLGGVTQYWSGTVAQMVTLATQVYAIVHANDSAAIAVTPSFSGGIGAPWSASGVTGGGGTFIDAFLSGGGAVGADAFAIHMYGSYTYSSTTYAPNTCPPEQVAWVLQWVKLELAAYGLSALPVLVTEGGWGMSPTSSGHTYTATETQAWGAAWAALMVSGGAERLLWYASDSAYWGTMLSGGVLTPGAVAYDTACAWLEGATFTAPIARQAGSNAVTNPNGSGSVAGSTPTGWALGNPDVWGGYGMTSTFVGYGPNGGVLFRYYGTATAGAGGYVSLYPVGGSVIAVTPGEFVTIGCNVRVAAGSMSGITGAALCADARNSGGTYLGASAELTVSLTHVLAPAVLSYPLNTANIAFLAPSVEIYYNVGTPIDITLEILGWDVDPGSIWSGDIARPGGYKGRIIWDAAGGPTTYTVPGWATYYRDVTGALHTITGGTVTLTNVPILLQNSAL